MNATGVAHRRGYAIIVLLAAVAVAAWLVHARLDKGDSSKLKTKPVGAAAPAAAPAEPAAPGGDGYGGAGAGAPAAAAPAAPAAPNQVGFVASGLTAKTTPRMGKLLTDNKDWTLYRFDGDTKGAETSGCEGTCAVAWPPILADDAAKLDLKGVDPNLVTLLPRADGTKQVAVAGWRAYRFAADGGPNKWLGQGRDRKWFVMQPTGAKNLSCIPSTPPAG
jgi:predicted lipoprotein with Yx(FWY)xxD motif